ncbi:hypothetical protein HUK80_00090 [Flavobacterium sp. MAH-1]|uniref:Uncharacterized protein n=1 Tax=Flavobacterium agri TaxID=2743471 RepID=A0A7Y8XYJ5_9FLAO|nr:hypothetical protein [Flavobacterium agri]NUY79275.1 hypothetical protein [Flavobacterium agri]NYA69299.1 hypothetical protein [Flavobacterium agri]
MKRLVFSVIVLLVVSCKKQQTDIPRKPADSKTAKIDWEKFERDVFQSIDSVEKASEQTRRQHLLKLMEYSDNVDGSVSEAYGMFAFEYMEKYPKLFFEVLTSTDTAVVRKWAKASSGEVLILAENDHQKDSILKLVQNHHFAQRKTFNAVETELDKLYLEKLDAAIHR